MKALLLAATSSLALTGFAVAQTATDATTTTETTAPAADAATTMDNAATAAGDAAATAGDRIEDAADSAENAVDSTVTTGTTDVAEDAADRAEDAADAAMTPGADAAATTTTTTMPADTATTTGGMTTETATTDSATTTTTTDVTTTTSGDTAATTAEATTVLTADNPGMLGSWIMNRRIWTTNQPSSTAWADTTLTERPAEWTDIAKVDDIVVDPTGNIVGYVADIGGFLGLGAKSVLLNPDALHFVQIGDDAFFATNYTREELEALPDFDTTTVMR